RARPAVPQPLLVVPEGMRGRRGLFPASLPVRFAELRDPLGVAPSLDDAHLREQRVVPVPRVMEREPRINPAADVVGVVVVAKQVMVVGRTHEEGDDQDPHVDDNRRLVDEPRPDHRVYDRPEQEPETVLRIAPVAVNEDVPGRRPLIVGRDPDPVRVGGRPETGPPDVANFPPDPAAGDPDLVLRGGLGGRPGLQGLRRRRQVLDLGYFRRGPIPRDPLVTLVSLVPIPGYPGLVGWDGSPEPAPPEKLFALVVPGPVAGNPGNVVALRLLIWGDFFNRFGGSFRGNGTRLRVEDGRLTEGLMDGPAGQ